MLRNIIRIYSLTQDKCQAVDLNDKCIVSMILTEGHTVRNTDGKLRVIRPHEQGPIYVSLAFQTIEEGTEECGCLAYQAMYGDEVATEEEFYEFMIEAQKNAEAHISNGTIKIDLRRMSHNKSQVTAS